MNILNCENALPVVVHVYIQECLNFVYVRYLESPAVSGISRAFAMDRYPTSVLVEDNQLTDDVISTSSIRQRRFRAAQDKATLEKKFAKLIASCAEELFVGCFFELVLGDSLNDTKFALSPKGDPMLPSFIRGIPITFQFSTPWSAVSVWYEFIDLGLVKSCTCENAFTGLFTCHKLILSKPVNDCHTCELTFIGYILCHRFSRLVTCHKPISQLKPVNVQKLRQEYRPSSTVYRAFCGRHCLFNKEVWAKWSILQIVCHRCSTILPKDASKLSFGRELLRGPLEWGTTRVLIRSRHAKYLKIIAQDLGCQRSVCGVLRDRQYHVLLKTDCSEKIFQSARNPLIHHIFRIHPLPKHRHWFKSDQRGPHQRFWQCFARVWRVLVLLASSTITPFVWNYSGTLHQLMVRKPISFTLASYFWQEQSSKQGLWRQLGGRMLNLSCWHRVRLAKQDMGRETTPSVSMRPYFPRFLWLWAQRIIQNAWPRVQLLLHRSIDWHPTFSENAPIERSVLRFCQRSGRSQCILQYSRLQMHSNTDWRTVLGRCAL